MWISSTLYLFVLYSIVQGLDEGCQVLGSSGKLKKKIIRVTGTENIYTPGYKESQTITEPIRCVYKLKAPENKHIRLKFNDFDFEASDMCSSVSLEILESHSSYSMTEVTLCGSEIPEDYVSKSNVVELRFNTDGVFSKRGANITYSLQESADLCSYGMLQCRNRKCVPDDKKCDGNDNCGDGTDEENCNSIPLGVQVCGRPSIDPLTSGSFDRIVGGQEVKPGSWPWMANIEYIPIEPSGHLCGGALINTQWVLSAGHCFKTLSDPKYIRIRLGNHHKFGKDEYEQVRYAKRIVVYGFEERAGRFDLKNDAALIELSAPVKFTSHVTPVCLPDPNLKLDSRSKCFAAGWGATRGSGGSDVLKQAHHPIRESIVCSKLNPDFREETMICAGNKDASGVCHGDSGGPLVCKTETNQWSIVGVTSFATDQNLISGLCGIPNLPTAFNNIIVKHDWIQSMVEKYS